MAKSTQCPVHRIFHAANGYCPRCETERELDCWRARARNAEEKVTEVGLLAARLRHDAETERIVARIWATGTVIFAVAFVISMVTHVH